MNPSSLSKLFEKFIVYYLRFYPHPCQIRIARFLIHIFRMSTILANTNQKTFMLLDPQDLVQWEILYKGSYENKTTTLIENLLKPGDIFLDVGGHVGYFSLIASKKVSSLGKVIVVEANPIVFNLLLTNISLNNYENILPVLGFAAFDDFYPISVSISNPENLGMTRASNLVKNIESFQTKYLSFSFRLSSLLSSQKLNCINLVKMDIEGAELDALKGLLDSNEFLPQHIIFEYLPDHFDKANLVLDFLSHYGYEFFDVEGNIIKHSTCLIENNIWAKLIGI